MSLHITSAPMNLEEFGKRLDGHRKDPAASLEDRLVDDCIHLLARLEAMVECLPSPYETDDDTHDTIEIAKEMVVIVLDFVTQRFGQDAVAHDLNPVCLVRDQSRELQKSLNLSFWSRLRSKPASHNSATQHAIRQLGKDFSDVIADILSRVDSQFAVPVNATEWKIGREMLIEEFCQRW